MVVIDYRVLKNWGGHKWLVQWLNSPGASDAKKRIMQALDLTHAILERSAQRDERYGLSDEDYDFLEKHRAKIDTVLSRFSAVPALRGLDVMHLDSAYFHWVPADKKADSHEWSAVCALMTLGEQGQLVRIRRCELKDCRKWYYGKSPLKKFCSTACKQKHKGQQPTFKANRRDYARDYYRKFSGKGAERYRKWLRMNHLESNDANYLKWRSELKSAARRKPYGKR